jgi:carbonic anhydrase
MVEGAPEQARDFVVPWMKIAEAAVPRARAAAAGGDVLGQAETEVVRLSLANLMTFPWIKEAVQAKRLALHGARFGIRSGVLEVLEGDRFEPVA